MIGFDILTENMREGDGRRHRVGDYCHVTLRPVVAHKLDTVPQGTFCVSGREIELRNPSDLDTDRLVKALGDLQIRCQGNNGDHPRQMYAWEVEYREVFAVDLRRVERMAWLLTRIHRRLERFAEKEGRPLTFGQFAGRVSRACGGRFFCTKADDIHGGYDESEYRLLPIGDGIWTIDRLIDEWKSAGPAAACA